MTYDEILPRVREVVAEALGIDENRIEPTNTLMGDLGAESMDLLDIVHRLENEFSIKIPRGYLFPEPIIKNNLHTVEMICRYVEQSLKPII